MKPENGRKLLYKTVGERELELLFFPPETPRRDAPVFFCIHGGGWHGSSKEETVCFTPEALDMAAARGIASVSIDYRLLGEPGVTMKEILEDCMDAARYLSKHAEALGVDPMRMVTCGHSAGGQLGLMMAFSPHGAWPGDPSLAGAPFRVTGSINMNGPTLMYPDADGVAVWGNHPVAGYRRVFPFGYEENPEAYIRISPCRQLAPDSPPLLCITSRKDEVIPCVHSEELCRRAQELGVPCRLVTVENAMHGYQPAGGEPAPSDTERQRLIVEFLMDRTK